MDSQKKNGERPYQPYNRGQFQERPGGRSFSSDRRPLQREGGFRERDDRFRGREGYNDRFSERRDFRARGDSRPGERRDFRDRAPEGRFQPKGGFAPKGRFQSKERFAKPWEKEALPKVYDEMQVTDGKHRGKFLKSTDSPKVRPTSRRVRETLFRLIYRRVKFSRFLDLCAGCGAVGIEAISRGALISTFVERSSKMCSFIKKNLETCGIKEGHGEVVEMEAVPYLKKMAKKKRRWDVVFFDPPYDENYDEVLELLGRGVALEPKGCLVLEHHTEMFFPERIGCLRRWKVVTNGETTLSFYERMG